MFLLMKAFFSFVTGGVYSDVQDSLSLEYTFVQLPDKSFRPFACPGEVEADGFNFMLSISNGSAQ